MNTPQRDLLAKTLADIAKGVSIAALIALGTNKMDLEWALVAIAGAVECYIIAHSLLTGGDE